MEPLSVLAVAAAIATNAPAAPAAAEPPPTAPVVQAAGPAAAEAVPLDVQAAAALARAKMWLLERQRDDGSFSNPKHPGLTGLALWALVGARHPSDADAIERAGDWLLSKAQPDGGIYQPVPDRAGGGLSTYNTAVCLAALAETGRRDATRAILDARTFLAGAQLTGDDGFAGGFGYASDDGGKRYADLNNTVFVMDAMRRSQRYEDDRPAGEKKADLDWAAALAFAESLHNGPGTGDQEGGFAYSPADAKAGTDAAASKDGAVVMRSYGSMTYAGLLALVYCDLDRADPRVRSTLDWAGRHWSLEENPGIGDQGVYFFYEIVSRALSAAGIESIPREGSDPVAWKDELVSKLLSLQRPDGSFANANGRFWENDPVLVTSYSMVALEFASGLLK